MYTSQRYMKPCVLTPQVKSLAASYQALAQQTGWAIALSELGRQGMSECVRRVF